MASQQEQPLVEKQKRQQSAITVIEEEDLDMVHAMQSYDMYTQNTVLLVFYYIFCVLTLGVLPLLIARWFPTLKLRMTQVKSKSIKAATNVLVKAKISGDLTVCEIFRAIVDVCTCVFIYIFKGQQYVLFTYRNVNFLYDDESSTFKPVVFDSAHTLSYILDNMSRGIDYHTRNQRTLLFGRNFLNVPVLSIFTLMLDEVRDTCAIVLIICRF